MILTLLLLYYLIFKTKITVNVLLIEVYITFIYMNVINNMYISYFLFGRGGGY